MARTVSVGGTNYTIPSSNEVDWGRQLTDFLVAVAAQLGGSATREFVEFDLTTTSPEVDATFTTPVSVPTSFPPTGVALIRAINNTDGAALFHSAPVPDWVPGVGNTISIRWIPGLAPGTDYTFRLEVTGD